VLTFKFISLGNIAKNLEQVVISGMSAGAFGAIFFSDYIIQNFPAKYYGVVSDSGVSVLPEIYELQLFYLIGTCSSGSVL